MDANLILAKTAKGIVQAKTEGGDLNYDAVRLLRLANGKATIGELRAKFEDLTDTRFQKAITTLEHQGLIRILAAHEADTGEYAELRKLDEQVEDLAQEVLQTLDFTKVERKLLDAVRSSPSEAAAVKIQQARKPQQSPAMPQGATAHTRPEPEAKARASREPRRDREADAKAKLVAELRPKVEKELGAKLIGALQPKIEEELRRELIAALRPALKAEIRAKLTAALASQVERELRARLNEQLARATHAPVQPQQEPSTHAAARGKPSPVDAANAIVPHERLLECMQEAVFQTDLGGKIVYVNPAWTQLTGHSGGDTLGRRLAEFFVAQDRRSVALCLDRIARSKATPPFFEANLARKVDGPLRVGVRAAPLTTIPGGIIGVCGTLRDAGAAQERGNGS